MAPTDPPADVPVFVYGTLRPGRRNWPVIRSRCRRHEPATIAGFALFDLDHPAIVRIDPRPGSDSGSGPGAGSGSAASRVAGDLVWFAADGSASVLARLDAFEGFDVDAPATSYYRRERLAVVAGAGRAVDAWVYLPGEHLMAQVRPERRVPSGDWL